MSDVLKKLSRIYRPNEPATGRTAMSPVRIRHTLDR